MGTKYLNFPISTSGVCIVSALCVLTFISVTVLNLLLKLLNI